eukprot:3289-Pelagococcus_subviridis.AAC.2
MTPIGDRGGCFVVVVAFTAAFTVVVASAAAPECFAPSRPISAAPPAESVAVAVGSSSSLSIFPPTSVFHPSVLASVARPLTTDAQPLNDRPAGPDAEEGGEGGFAVGGGLASAPGAEEAALAAAAAAVSAARRALA